MEYSHRLSEISLNEGNSKKVLEEGDLIQEWWHLLRKDFRYTQLTPAKRRNFLLKRLIYDRTMEKKQDKPRVVALALSYESYLELRELTLEDEVLAGSYQFSDFVYTHPLDPQDEYDCLVSYAEDYKISYHEEDLKLMLSYIAGGFCSKNPGGHVIADYPRLLKIGLGAILNEIAEGREKYPDDVFLQAAEITIYAATNYIMRYSRLAAQKAQKTLDANSKEKLKKMAESCRWVSKNPPRTFHEAVQLITLIHELIISEQLCGSLSLGRFDYYVAPYYEEEKRKGTITFEQAQEIVESLWKKLGTNRHSYQNVTLGGYDDVSGYCGGDITKICLRASGKYLKDEPMPTFRWHKTMPEELWDDVENLIRKGIGFPAVFCDDVVFRAKERAGISKEDAQQYGVVGCVEISVPGKEYGHTEGLRVNWAKILEIMLNDGKCTLTGKRYPLKTRKNMSDIQSFEEFYSWYKEELLFTVSNMIDELDQFDRFYPHYWPVTLLSIFMDNCVKSRKDVTNGGTVYNESSVNNCGMANVADSLLAIQKFVFEKKVFSLAELTEMVNKNFEGFEKERQRIFNGIDRFGNDHGEAEAILKDLTDALYEMLETRRNFRGGRYILGYYGVYAQATFGMLTGALPDGRLAKTPLSNSMAPVQGTEINGPTAIASSVVSIDHSQMANGMVLDYKFSSDFFSSETHRKGFRALVEGYFELGGMEMQFNVVDKQTLLDAQKHPDEYEGLVVRVSGFSAYFNDLNKNVQDEIIMRTEFRGISG